MTIRHEIRICGYGGQGIVLAGYIAGQASAIFDGKHVTFIQDYGPAARGGVCRADVVISDERVLYPYINSPSILVAMFQEAYDKYHPKNREDALVIVDSNLVKPKKLRGKRLLTAPVTQIAESLKSTTVANVVMLGFFTAVTDIISVDAMRKSITASVPKGTTELNLRAFEQGYNYASENPGPN